MMNNKLATKATLPELCALWVDGRLGYIEYICLKSMVSCGHSVTLYTYGKLTNVPDGVTVKDANQILPRARLLRHKKSGSYSLGSNIFRYELLQQRKVIWVDADIYCLKPIPWFDGYVFGWESDRTINGAVLGMPSDAAILSELESYYNARVFLPPWWSHRRKINNILRSIIGIDKKAANVGWGVLGPKAITYFVKKTSTTAFAQKVSVFYPIPIDNIDEIFNPDATPENYIKAETLTVHLWNEMIKQEKRKFPPEGSYIHKLCIEQGLDNDKLHEMVAS